MIDVMAFGFLSPSDFPWNAQDEIGLLLFVATDLIISATNALRKESIFLYLVNQQILSI